MPNLTLVKFLLNFKHQILAEISSGVMLFLRCKPHFSLTDLLFKPSQKILTARHNPPRILEASFARASMGGKHGATMVQLN